MKKTIIHQFHAGSAYGDAITNSMLLIRRLLLKMGCVSNIYAQQVAPELESELYPHTKLTLKPEDTILIHHSMGHDIAKWVMTLPGKKILVYHNITPAQFFPEGSAYRHYSVLGREQLRSFLPVMEASICDSKVNADELADLGYENIRVIPLLIDINALQNKNWDTSPVDDSSDLYTILFVGRICPNKCQEDLITIAGYLKTMLNRPFQLVLVGCYAKEDPYFQKLSAQITMAGLNDCVKFTGGISDAELYGWYRAADLFLCMSEHEGFGVPLIEAMAFDVPVVAFKSSNVPYTLGGAGVLITRKDHCAIAGFIKIFSRDRSMKRVLVRDQQRQTRQFSLKKMGGDLYTFLKEQGIDVPNPPELEPAPIQDRPVYQVEGPFESSYSLALVNREIALALDRKNPGKVGLFATEGPGDYLPDTAAIQTHVGVEALWENGCKASRAQVVIRNLYPPRVADMDGQINLLYFAWEESMLPFEWVQAFNRHLDGMPVLSEFIKKILIDNGVSLPITAAGCGIDHIMNQEASPYPLEIKTGYNFLHISSCFPRKGVDLLLLAFAKTFTRKDDVGLVIKTFPNIHNTIEDQVKDLKEKFPLCAPIEVINKELASPEIAGLYKSCDALVAPSRGEGFGLPMAEAMWYGIPVITTAYGGQSDFCTHETSWLIDFSFQAAKTHMGLFHSVWAEPEPGHLGALMKELRSATPGQIQPRLAAAKQLVVTQFTWDRCVTRLKSLEKQIRQVKPLAAKKINLGWVSSWDSKCGIAVYSKFLTDALSADFNISIFASGSGTAPASDTNVFRCWTGCKGDIDALLSAIALAKLDALVLQFNFAFFSPGHLEKIIVFAKKRRIVLLFFFHSTKDVTIPGLEASLGPVSKSLALVDRLLVHGIEDLNLFKSRGLVKNTAIFPHGVLNRLQVPKIKPGKTIIASYGFMLPHKGLEQLIQAFAILEKTHSDLHLLMVNALYPDGVSEETKSRCQTLIEKNHLNSVTMVTDFLKDEDSFALLDHASIIVFPYQATAESSSAAVRYGLATRCPVACTPLDIFSDVKEVVHFLPGTDPKNIAAGIEHLLLDTGLLNSKVKIQEDWLATHSWDVLGQRLGNMIKGLVCQREFGVGMDE